MSETSNRPDEASLFLTSCAFAPTSLVLLLAWLRLCAQTGSRVRPSKRRRALHLEATNIVQPWRVLFGWHLLLGWLQGQGHKIFFFIAAPLAPAEEKRRQRDQHTCVQASARNLSITACLDAFLLASGSTAWANQRHSAVQSAAVLFGLFAVLLTHGASASPSQETEPKSQSIVINWICAYPRCAVSGGRGGTIRNSMKKTSAERFLDKANRANSRPLWSSALNSALLLLTRRRPQQHRRRPQLTDGPTLWELTGEERSA